MELNSRYLTDVIIERIVVDMGRVVAEEIAEDEVVGSLLVEESLIVDASIERSRCPDPASFRCHIRSPCHTMPPDIWVSG